MFYQETEVNTILIVDDEPNNLKVLHDLLTNGAKDQSENSAMLILLEGASGCIS